MAAKADNADGTPIDWPAARGAGLTSTVSPVTELETGPQNRFADWPNEQVPRRAAEVDTIWRADQFVYVGMSGRGAQREDFISGHDDTPRQANGLWTRLGSHASGRRSGDQFNVYVCDRFVVPGLTTEQQHHDQRRRSSSTR